MLVGAALKVEAHSVRAGLRSDAKAERVRSPSEPRFGLIPVRFREHEGQKIRRNSLSNAGPPTN